MFQSAGMILPHECHKKHPLMWDFDSQTAANVSEVETKVLLCAFPTNDKESDVELCWWEDTNVTDKTRKCIPNPIQHFCYEPLALFPPSKHCDKAVLPFLFFCSLFPFFSLLCPLLLDLHAAFVLSGCENLPLPIMERQREGRGRVLPAAQPAKQAGSLSVFPWKAATHLFPRLPAVNTEHGEVCQRRKTMQPMLTQT